MKPGTAPADLHRIPDATRAGRQGEHWRASAGRRGWLDIPGGRRFHSKLGTGNKSGSALRSGRLFGEGPARPGQQALGTAGPAVRGTTWQSAPSPARPDERARAGSAPPLPSAAPGPASARRRRRPPGSIFQATTSGRPTWMAPTPRTSSPSPPRSSPQSGWRLTAAISTGSTPTPTRSAGPTWMAATPRTSSPATSRSPTVGWRSTPATSTGPISTTAPSGRPTWTAATPK